MQRQQYPSRLANTDKNASTADNTSSTAESEEAEHLRLSQDLICSHPLYPLLSSIFEKCELSTCASRDPPPTATASPDTEVSAAATAGDADGCSSSSFDQDIANFARELDASNAGAFTGDQDLDSVMIQAIQVLRFHLLELEKVHELCDNFCSRYITCLRGKMMLSDAVQPQQQQPLGSVPVASMSGFSSSPQSETEATASSSSILQPPLGLPHPYQQPVADQASIILPAPPTPLPPPLLASAGHEHPVQLSMPTDTGIAFEGFESSLASGENVQDELLHNGTDEMVPGSAGAASSSDSVDEVTVPARQRQQRKRGIFPKCATNVMRAWLFQHLSHPYPSEEQKKQLAADTGLTILQVNNWFINARRRIVQPMIDQSNQPGPHDFGPESVFTSSYAAAMEAQQQPQQLCYSGAGFPVPQVSLEAAAAAAAVGFPSYHPAPPVPPAAYPQPLHEHHQQQQQQQQVPFPPACFGRHSNRRSFGQLQKQESFSTDKFYY